MSETADKLLSVIIPVYNTEKYLAKCLVTVLNQTHKKLEVIIVDDGSTDKSAEIYTQYANKDKRMKIIYQTNAGAATARNAGLCAASGEYIHFMDADDLIPFDFYEKMLLSAINTKADMSCCGVYDESLPDKSFRFEQGAIKEDISDKIHIVLGLHRGTVWGYLFKKDFLTKHNLIFDTQIKAAVGEDTIFVTKAMYYANKITQVPKLRYFYKYHQDSVMNINDENIKQIRNTNHRYAMEKIIEFAKEHNFAHLFIFKEQKIIQTNGIYFDTKHIGNMYSLQEIFSRHEYEFGGLNNYVFIDVGANVGDSALYIAAQESAAKIYAYEPFPNAHKSAKNNIKLNPKLEKKIKLFNEGWGNENKTLKVYEFNDPNDNVFNSMENFAVNKFPEKNKQLITIKLKKSADILRRIITKHKKQPIVLKMDIEGGEYVCFEDLDKAGLVKKIDIILLEWHYKGSEPITKILEKNGFVWFNRVDVNSTYTYGLLRAYNAKKKIITSTKS